MKNTTRINREAEMATMTKKEKVTFILEELKAMQELTIDASIPSEDQKQEIDLDTLNYRLWEVKHLIDEMAEEIENIEF